jgi:hypothetical protein
MESGDWPGPDIPYSTYNFNNHSQYGNGRERRYPGANPNVRSKRLT